MITRLNRAFQRQHVENVSRNHIREYRQLFQRHVRQVALFSHTEGHGFAHNFVRVTERHAFLDQVVGQIRCGGEPPLGGDAHIVSLGFNGRHHVGICLEAAFNGIHHIKQWFLVFLVVLVVSQRLAFHQGQ